MISPWLSQVVSLLGRSSNNFASKIISHNLNQNIVQCSSFIYILALIIETKDFVFFLVFPEIVFKLKIECRMKRNILRKVCGIYERYPEN